MSFIVITLIALLGTISLLIAFLAWRKPVARKVGARNVRRRLGNTILVIIGSLVGTALISGSLVMADSLDATFENFVDKQLGEVDLRITVENEEFSPSPLALLSNAEVDQVKNILSQKDIDGILSALVITGSPQRLDNNGEPVINSFNVVVYGASLSEIDNFGENPQQFADWQNNNGAHISETLAEQLEAEEGDKLAMSFAGKELSFTIEKIYEDKGIIGGKTIITSREFLAQQFEVPQGSVNQFFVSASGGVEPTDYEGAEFNKTIQSALEDFSSERVRLTTEELKQEALDGYGLKMFAQVFLVLSLFGIAAGILLIANLYLMLASERKMEMGILRAIAFTRMQLALSFAFEGYLYSIISSMIGAIMGLGIGYALVRSMAGIFANLFAATGESAFEIVFAFEWSSLVIAFTVGALITLFTSLYASIRVSGLNIVSAIRNIPEEHKAKITIWWVLKTGALILLLLNGLMNFIAYFFVAGFLEQGREQGGENNALADMSQSQFNETVSLAESYALYIGVIMTLFLSAAVINRFVYLIWHKKINRLTLTIASIGAIGFTAFIPQLDSYGKALETDASIGLLFISGITLVVSLALIITYNLKVITRITNIILEPVLRSRAVMRIALRYPGENQSRTGLTLVMFSLIIFLVAFLSINKAMSRELATDTISKSLGGYNIIIQPNPQDTQQQVDKIYEAVASNEGIEKVQLMTHVPVVLPEYIYDDLPEAPYWGDPAMIPKYDEDDPFQTSFNIVPKEFIEKGEVKLSERAEGYDSDEEVWDTVYNDSDKIVLGAAFTGQGYGRQPEIDVGEQIAITDIFTQQSVTKEVIGLVDATVTAGPSVSFYANIITNEESLQLFADDYIDRYANSDIVVKAADGQSVDKLVNEIKKDIITYNISNTYSVDEVAGVMLSFIEGFNTMFQGFLAFSLLVGVSGLAIIMIRSVNERRQQIGMLRSLGFQSRMILGSFFIESTFIVLLAALIGISTGVLSMQGFVTALEDDSFQLVIPWGEIFIITGAVYIASMIFSLFPSAKAAKLSPVEATNYPE